MAIVSLTIPFVVGYIAYFWRQMDKKSIKTEELDESDKY
jgi:cytochrome bd-type quinol oxidase subunit 2